MIGFPLMVPHYAHGMFVKSDSYISYEALQKDIDQFLNNNISIEGVSLPSQAVVNQYLF